MCDIFGITVDELIGSNNETAVTTTVTETIVTPTPTKIIAGYCSICRKGVAPGEYYQQSAYDGQQLIYCKDCKAKQDKAVKDLKISEDNKELRVSFIWASIVAIAILVIGIIVSINNSNFAGIPVALAIAYGGFAFTSQMIWFGSVMDVFLFFCRSFTMPGVIFTLNWDGIIFLIGAKILLGIISGVLSVLLFLLGCVISVAYSMISFPFALIARLNENHELKKQ